MLAAFFFYAAFSQHLQPWQLLHGWFASVLPAHYVTIVLAVTGLAMAADALFIALSLAARRAPSVRVAAVTLSAVPLLFWAVAFYRIRFLPLHLLLLACAAPLVTAVCWYVEHTVGSVGSGLAELSKLKFAYKKA